ncbi:ribosome biogenesis protein C1orf109-like [Ostrea edulis]|uniref:ribosome biogenesis protein C1orf109-like n=1 Tax=Ostrea edulis TaxID=37623 RepID=UPI0024AFE6B6|nr:ribosome biogenesis protein C1orf109-like [Ostrea edulis]
MEYDLCETGKGNPMFLKLLQNLQKAFSIVKTNLKIWDEAITSSRSHLDSVQNLSEQHHCCKHAEGLNDITKKFPDVKAKLLYKIDTEINSHMTHLYAAVDVCKVVCDKVIKQNERCQAVYKKVCNDLDLITQRSPTCPSAVEMFEWLHDSECLMMRDYQKKKHLLAMFSLTERDHESALYKQWCAGDRELHQTINEYLQYMEFFLEMKIIM